CLVPFASLLCALALPDALPILCSSVTGSVGPGASGCSDRSPGVFVMVSVIASLDVPARTADGGNPQCADRDTTGIGSRARTVPRDRKSTRLNSSHVKISYAVFC